MENFSLSDLAAVTNNDGLGGNWILILLFAMIFGWNGSGFGGNRQGEFGQYATAASQQEILFGQQFQNLNASINKVGDGLASLGYSQLQQMDNNTAAINGNIVNEGRAIQTQLAECCCSVKEAVHSEGEATRAMISQNKIETLQAELNNVQMQMAINNAVSNVPKINPYMYGIIPTCGCNCN